MLTKEELHTKIAAGLRYLDGATGSNLQKAGMPKGCCTERWVLENPQALVDLQKRYCDAGCQILYAPTFQAQPMALERVGLAGKTEEILDIVSILQEVEEKVQGNYRDISFGIATRCDKLCETLLYLQKSGIKTKNF